MSGDLEHRLADLVADVSGGEISAEQALAGDHSLSALGLTSLAWIRLIDAIEDAFEVDLDLGGDLSAFERVDALAAHLSGLLDAR
ncbi:acyl carrier protein [Nonomuraea fuscirosea]|uniref:acyl carrier protein n=1 Tax=Nonomuraea fuscirosea TaxID=1291556 RepID=UPI00341C00CF